MAVKQKAGDLEELRSRDEVAWMQIAPYAEVLKYAKTLEKLQDAAKARGYDRRWALRMWQYKSGGYRRGA